MIHDWHLTSVTYWVIAIRAIFSWITPYFSILSPNWVRLAAWSTCRQRLSLKYWMKKNVLCQELSKSNSWMYLKYMYLIISSQPLNSIHTDKMAQTFNQGRCGKFPYQTMPDLDQVLVLGRTQGCESSYLLLLWWVLSLYQIMQQPYQICHCLRCSWLLWSHFPHLGHKIVKLFSLAVKSYIRIGIKNFYYIHKVSQSKKIGQ